MKTGKIFLGLLFCSCLSIPALADTADSLSVSIDEADWEGGMDISFGVDSVTNVRPVCPDDINRFIEVFDLTGRIVCQCTSVDEALNILPRGIYIIARRKYCLH